MHLENPQKVSQLDLQKNIKNYHSFSTVPSANVQLAKRTSTSEQTANVFHLLNWVL